MDYLLLSVTSLALIGFWVEICVSTCGDILRASEGSENKNDKLFVPKGEKA
jgi:hypothetical protein